MDLRATRYDVDAYGIATVTLHRPDRHNAWTGRMHTEYRWCMAQADADPVVRVVVVTGAGSTFCVGADTQALAGHAERGAYDSGVPDDVVNPGYGRHSAFDADFAWHFALRVPVIAAINGACAGVGLVLACYCDLRFVRSDAKLTTAAPKLGLPAEYGLSWLLPRLIGATRAADLLLSGRVVLGTEAAAMGLANAALPADELVAHVHSYAHMLATSVSPASLEATKRQMYGDLVRHGLGDSVRESAALLSSMMAGADYREGVAALQERRPPRF